MGGFKFSELPHPRKPKQKPKSARMHRNHGKRRQYGQHEDKVDYWQPPVMLNPPRVNWRSPVISNMPRNNYKAPKTPKPSRVSFELEALLTMHGFNGCPQNGDFPDKKTFQPTQYWTDSEDSDEEVEFLGSTAPLPSLKNEKPLSRRQKLKQIRNMGPQNGQRGQKRSANGNPNQPPNKRPKKTAKNEAQRQLMAYNDEFGGQNVNAKQGKKSKSSRKRRRCERMAAQKAGVTLSKKERRKIWWEHNGNAN